MNSSLQKSAASAAIALMFLAPSCKRYDKDIQRLDGRIDRIENTQIKTLDQQVDAINKSLPQLQKTDEELKGYITKLQGTASDLQKSITETDGKIAKVREYLERAISDAQADDAALKEELTSALNTAKSDILSQLASAKTDMKGQLDRINETITELRAKDTELEKKISDLKTWTGGEIQKSKDWAAATFATLEQYNSVTSEIVTIKQSIEGLESSVTAMETKLKESISKELDSALEPVKEQISSEVIKEVTSSYTSAISAAKTELTEAYKAEISSSISSLEISLKNWVNSTLTGYYTVSETDAKLSSLKSDLERQLKSQRAYLEGLLENLSDSISAGISGNKELIESVQSSLASVKKAQEANATEISALKEELTESKDALTEAYKKAIGTAVSELDGKLTSDMKSEIEKVNKSIDAKIADVEQKLSALDARVSTLENSIVSIKADINTVLEELTAMKDHISKLVKRIISISHVPTFYSGEEYIPYKLNGNIPVPGNFTIRFEVAPASAAEEIVAVWKSAVSVKGVYTRASLKGMGDFVQVPVVSVSAESGILSVTMSGEGIDNVFFIENTKKLNVRLKISSGSDEVLSEYIRMQPYKDLSDSDYFDKNGVYQGQSVEIDGLIWAPVNAGANGSNIYGELYNFADAADACPAGWRLPTNSELSSLSKNRESSSSNGVFGFDFYGSNSPSADKPKVFFPAAGHYTVGSVVDKGSRGCYWSSDESANSSPSSAYGLTFSSSGSVGSLVANVDTKNSVRCVKGEKKTTEPTVGSNDYVDAGGKNWGTAVKIGNLYWAPVNCGATASNLYGGYYTYSSSQTACPSGWRLPTSSELSSLSAHYSSLVSYNGMKGRWFSGASAYSGSVPAVFFPAVGGSGKNKDVDGEYWSSSEYYDPTWYFKYTYLLKFDNTSISSDKELQDSKSTYSIRCVKK